MPAEGIHVTAVREATAAPGLAPELRRRLIRHDDAARFGAILVDLPYFHQFALEVMRYRGIRRLPVIGEDDQLVGIISIDDMLEVIAEELTDIAKIVTRERAVEAATRK